MGIFDVKEVGRLILRGGCLYSKGRSFRDAQMIHVGIRFRAHGLECRAGIYYILRPYN